MAAQNWNVSPDSLTVDNGMIMANSGEEISYWKLLEGKFIEERITGEAKPKSPKDYKYVGEPLKRGDIEKMVKAESHFVQDLQMPGMVHARVVHPPSYENKLQSINLSEVEAMPGVLKVIRNGSFLAVVAVREYQAIKAWEKLKSLAVWETISIETLQADLHKSMKQTPGKPQDVEVSPGIEKVLANSEVQHEAEYFRPYLMHASVGPSCSLAFWEEDQLTIWSPTQGVYPARGTLADLFSIKEENIRCIGLPGSGCYGHNGADDVTAEAALIAKEMPGKQVRLQWMREDENKWEPYGSSMAFRLSGGVDSSGKLLAWDSIIWSDSHSSRPNGRAGSFISARHLESAFEFNKGGFSGGSYRNGIPEYVYPYSCT